MGNVPVRCRYPIMSLEALTDILTELFCAEYTTKCYLSSLQSYFRQAYQIKVNTTAQFHNRQTQQT